MYWVVYISSVAVLIIATIILDRKGCSWSYLIGLVAFIWGLAGLCIGPSRPNLYIVKNNGGIEEYKNCIRWNYTLNDGTRIALHADSTYIVNESGQNLCLEDIQYLRRDYFDNAPAFTYRDTLQSRVLSFNSNDVCAFMEAPSYLEGDGKDLVRRIIVVSLERQHFSPNDNRYRSLSEPEDDSWLFYSYFTNI